ncbi:hypothetical protein MPER_09288 [Moniliophthora perniciosa FA553]|nr:hypothetical protein MPER_09288 [Moniliophthora perniciosa FA553]
MLSQSGKTTSFDFQFPQPDINATPQAPQALSLPVPNVMQGNTVAGNDIMGSDDELDDDDDDDADDDDEETNGSTKAAKGKKRKGFNGLELDAMQRRVGKLACKLYALHIASEDAWLDDPTGEANASQPVSTAGDRREQVAVQKWFTARGAVESCTGLDLSETKPTGEEITLDPTNVNEPQSIYRNALIEEVIVHALFNNDAKSIGALAGSAFGNLMPLPTIALAATAIECAIDEFYKGVRKTIKFKGSTYCKIYRHHLRQLSNWNEHQPESLAVFQSSLMADVKSAAGIDIDVDAASIEQRADVPLSRFS